MLGSWTTNSDDLSRPRHWDGLRVQTRFKPSALLVERVFYYDAGTQDPLVY
jgi:hypothetical protein